MHTSTAERMRAAEEKETTEEQLHHQESLQAEIIYLYDSINEVSLQISIILYSSM